MRLGDIIEFEIRREHARHSSIENIENSKLTLVRTDSTVMRVSLDSKIEWVPSPMYVERVCASAWVEIESVNRRTRGAARTLVMLGEVEVGRLLAHFLLIDDGDKTREVVTSRIGAGLRFGLPWAALPGRT